MKIDFVKTILKFKHEITADKITIFRTKFNGDTLLKQIDDDLKEQLSEVG